MTSLSELQKWVCRARGSWGFCTLTPASIQIKRWQKVVGVGSRAPLIKQWSWLLQEAAISHWSLGTVWKSHKGLCLSMSITVCTQSYSRVGSANLCSFLIPPGLKTEGSIVSVPKNLNIKQQQNIYSIHWQHYIGLYKQLKCKCHCDSSLALNHQCDIWCGIICQLIVKLYCYSTYSN